MTIRDWTFSSHLELNPKINQSGPLRSFSADGKQSCRWLPRFCGSVSFAETLFWR